MSHWFILLPFLFLTPALLLRLLRGRKVSALLSPVVACFIAGIALGNAGVLRIEDALFEPLSAATVLLAIPLLLITTDFKGWLLRSGPALKAIAIAILGVSMAAFVSMLIFGHLSQYSPRVLAMITSCVIGSSINMSAVGISLNTPAEIFTLVITTDVLCGSVFFLYLVGLGPKLYRWLLPVERRLSNEDQKHLQELPPSGPSVRSAGFLKDLFLSFCVAVLLAAVSVGFTKLVMGELRDDIILVVLTILGILCGTFSSKIRALRTADASGQYLLLVFSLAIGLKADFSAILGSGKAVLILVSAMYVLTAIFQLLLYRVFRIPADTAAMATAGTVFSPVFVGQIAAAFDNKQVLLTGMITAIAGYAVGNFLGLLAYRLLVLML